jgi:glycerate kinase
MPGGGASGGLGTGLVLLGARLRPRFEAVTEYFGIDNLFDDCQLVFTAEGELDYQTPRGKIPAEVATRAKRHGIPVIALAGTIGTKANVNYAVGIDAFTSITQGPISLENAIRNAETLLTDCAERAMRMVIVGMSLPRDSPRVVAYKPARTRHIFLLSSLLSPLVPAAVYLWVALFSLIYFHTLL